MKRFAIVLLALCLLCGTASAEALRVFDIGQNERDGYLSAYPDRAVEEIQAEYDDNGRNNAQDFLLQNPDSWDVAFIWTDQCDLTALDRAGLIMDLSGESQLSQQVGGMYPAVQRAVTDDKRVLAVPAHMFGGVMQLTMASTTRVKGEDVDIIGPLGMTEADAPRTFDELCALAQRYMALPKETRKGTAFNIDAAASNPEEYFLQYLIDLYTAQYRNADGSIAYDTPEFRHALESLRAMTDALTSEEKISYGQGGTVYGLINDASSTLLSNYSHLLYLRVGENTNIPARLGMLVVNANTARKAEALDFVASTVENHTAEAGPLLWEKIDYDALARISYDENIKAQVYQKEDQSVIDELTKERDSGGYPRYYSKESIAAYAQNVAPHLTFPRLSYMDSSAIVKEYVKGQFDADGLIERLNGIAAENAAQ